jgi:hypothetical protein
MLTLQLLVQSWSGNALSNATAFYLASSQLRILELTGGMTYEEVFLGQIPSLLWPVWQMGVRLSTFRTPYDGDCRHKSEVQVRTKQWTISTCTQAPWSTTHPRFAFPQPKRAKYQTALCLKSYNAFLEEVCGIVKQPTFMLLTLDLQLLVGSLP